MTNERVKELFLLVMNDTSAENIEKTFKELSEEDFSDKKLSHNEIVNCCLLGAILLKDQNVKELILRTNSWVNYANKIKNIVHDTCYVETFIYPAMDEKITEFGYIQKEENGLLKLVKI